MFDKATIAVFNTFCASGFFAIYAYNGIEWYLFGGLLNTFSFISILGDEIVQAIRDQKD